MRIQARNLNLRHIANLQQSINASKLLELALVEDGDTVANVFGHFERVGRHEDGHTPAGQLLEKIFDHNDGRRIKQS